MTSINTVGSDDCAIEINPMCTQGPFGSPAAYLSSSADTQQILIVYQKNQDHWNANFNSNFTFNLYNAATNTPIPLVNNLVTDTLAPMSPYVYFHSVTIPNKLVNYGIAAGDNLVMTSEYQWSKGIFYQCSDIQVQ